MGAALLSSSRDDARHRQDSYRALLKHSGDLVAAVRRQRDVEGYRLAIKLARQRHPDRTPAFGHTRVELIDVTGHNWLNFDLHRDEMQELFEKGLSHAEKTLKSLDDPSTEESRHG